MSVYGNEGAEVGPARIERNIAAMVREFHQTFGIPIRSTPDAQPPEHRLRVRLLREEVREYVDAVNADDVVEVADGLADIVYVAYGSALAHGIDLDAVLREVHRSNMSKLGPDGEPILREDGKVVKGPGFLRPDIAAVLDRLNDARSCVDPWAHEDGRCDQSCRRDA